MSFLVDLELIEVYRLIVCDEGWFVFSKVVV